MPTSHFPDNTVKCRHDQSKFRQQISRYKLASVETNLFRNKLYTAHYLWREGIESMTGYGRPTCACRVLLGVSRLVGGSAASGVHCLPGANMQFLQCLVRADVCMNWCTGARLYYVSPAYLLTHPSVHCHILTPTTLTVLRNVHDVYRHDADPSLHSHCSQAPTIPSP